jgi:hypothetical protein
LPSNFRHSSSCLLFEFAKGLEAHMLPTYAL